MSPHNWPPTHSVCNHETRTTKACPDCHDPTAQGTKACLGWERAPEGGLHSCTAVVDSWLRLLQRALHAVRALRFAVPATPPAIGLKPDG